MIAIFNIVTNISETHNKTINLLFGLPDVWEGLEGLHHCSFCPVLKQTYKCNQWAKFNNLMGKLYLQSKLAMTSILNVNHLGITFFV